MKYIIIVLILVLFNQEQKVTATIYHAVPGQTDFDLNNPRKHNIVAVSRDLEALGFTLGSQVEVTGAGDLDGIWNIEDRMNKRFTKRIDFLVNTTRKGGKWLNVTIKKVTK